MKKATLGLLLSGLVFPGLGHLVLKAYKRAIALMLTTMVCFITIMVTAIQQVNAVMEKIQAEGGIIDLDSVTLAANQAVSAADQATYNISYFILVCCWLVGVIDGYRVGKQKDSEISSAD
ncbi:MAG: hypothetical protein OQK76_06390 [Gammaproteobacteria bacterium]|nr:hypothetical protein [Gammaproteobacteria bacterium]MCW8910233.1 hypothetical protein [Gammaproteobacteria bacterium]MCW9005133.1 hypothetical protein [Gammaproteobacteria bacterium]MCW9056647.1 hypothetical protein [Gammaproteobacteria bacterium]